MLPGENIRFMSTGDLGAVAGADLYVLGRTKEIIRVHGVTYHPSDIEAAARHADPSLLVGRIAAFPAGVMKGEGIGLALESREESRAGRDDDALIRAVVREVARRCGTRPILVAVVPRHAIPVTTSGKMQRAKIRQLLATGGIHALTTWSYGDG
jgi:acyl-CoA synthetase (AMP-forming)/AMP-acid ligase II